MFVRASFCVCWMNWESQFVSPRNAHKRDLFISWRFIQRQVSLYLRGFLWPCFIFYIPLTMTGWFCHEINMQYSRYQYTFKTHGLNTAIIIYTEWNLHLRFLWRSLDMDIKLRKILNECNLTHNIDLGSMKLNVKWENTSNQEILTKYSITHEIPKSQRPSIF
jgi:hypothetical protein